MKIKKFKQSKREFRYLILEPDPNGLWIHLTSEGKEELENTEEITDDNFYDLFEDVQGNSEYIFHSDLGQSGLGLTEAPGITDGYIMNDNGSDYEEYYDSGIIYIYPDSYKKSFMEDLFFNGKVFFKKVDWKWK